MLWSSKVGTGVDCWLDNIQENPFQPRWLEVASRALSLAPGLAAAVVFPKWPPGKPEEVMLRSDFVFPVFRFFWNHYCVESKENRAASCLQLCESFLKSLLRWVKGKHCSFVPPTLWQFFFKPLPLSKRKTGQLFASNSVKVFFYHYRWVKGKQGNFWPPTLWKFFFEHTWSIHDFAVEG